MMMASTVKAAVCLCLWLAVCQVRGSHIPVKMNKTIQNLLQHYKITDDERFDGNPVFSRDLLSGKMETKMLFMGGVLETYKKLIGHMLKQAPTPSPRTTAGNELPATAVRHGAGTAGNAETGPAGDVREGLRFILDKVEELKTKRYQEQAKLLHGLSALKHVQMDNYVVQSKALWELPWLYEEASSLSENNAMKRRRRRHARRAKAHLRA